MRYKISTDVEVKSENAALSSAQKSKHLCSIIGDLDRVDSTLDFGCGKLRYFEEIKKITKRLYVSDSELQLSRQQKVLGEMTSVNEFAKRHKQLITIPLEKFRENVPSVQRAFCINVLSAIPDMAARNELASCIRESLVDEAECLFVTQYRNSYFKNAAKSEAARDHLDGFILDSRRGFSFYGVIDDVRLAEFLTKNGFEVTNSTTFDGSAYIWAKKT